MKDVNAESTMPASSWLRLRASAVHLYTASGAVLTLLILVAAYNGDAVMALWLMLATLVIDSTDGLLARRFRVKELLPSFDGMLLDNIVDHRLPAGRCLRSGLGGAPAPRVQLPILPGGRQDRERRPERPLLLGLPQLLEHSGVLRYRLRPRSRGRGRDPRRLLALGLRARPVRLPLAHGRLPQAYRNAHGALARELRRHPHPDAQPRPAPQVVLALLPNLLLRSELLPLRQGARRSSPSRGADRITASAAGAAAGGGLIRVHLPSGECRFTVFARG